MKKYSIDIVELLTELYKAQGRNLFTMIENVTKRMETDEDRRFFKGDLSRQVEIIYTPTRRAATKLPLEVYDYFTKEKAPSAGAFYGYDPFPVVDRFRDIDHKRGTLYFSDDVAELLLVLTNKVRA